MKRNRIKVPGSLRTYFERKSSMFDGSSSELLGDNGVDSRFIDFNKVEDNINTGLEK